MMRAPLSQGHAGSRAASPAQTSGRSEAAIGSASAPVPGYRFADLAVGSPGEAPLQLKRKRRGKRWRKPRPQAPRQALAQDPNDRTMSFRDLPPGPVRAYRMEASTQQYDDKSERPKWAHFHVGSQGSNANSSHLYLPKPTSNYSGRENRYTSDDPRRRYRPKTKGLSRDDQSYAHEFLKNQRDTGRNTMFVNFAEPKRALELYRQKKANEPHLNFNIKSTLVPASTFAELRKQSVHEADAQKYPTRPFNVDRKAPNQLGLRERHIDLLNATALKGSARVEDIAKLEKKFGPALDEEARRSAPKPPPPHPGRHGRKGKRTRARVDRNVPYVHDPMEDEDEEDLQPAPRPRGRRLGDFFSIEDQRRFGYDPDS
jgi:hypothetical protein